MRKNLTISLSREDWQKVQAMVRQLGETYSAVFHRLIQAGTSQVCDDTKTAKYRALLSSHGDFLADRAGAFAKAGRRGRTGA